MRKMPPDRIIEKYVEYAIIEDETKLNGDFKLGNQTVKKMHKLIDQIKEQPSIREYVLSEIMHSDIDRARNLAAVYALRFRILTKEAVNVLEECCKKSNYIGFGSKCALDMWRGESEAKFEYYVDENGDLIDKETPSK